MSITSTPIPVSALPHSGITGQTANDHHDRSHTHAVGADSTTLSPVTLNVGTGGLQFPATQAAVADANALDDFEIGTFTPTLHAASGSASGYTTQVGRYTKIGNRCIFNLRMTVSGIGTLSGNSYVGGLPFTSVDVGDAESPAFTGLTLSLAITAGAGVAGHIGQNSTNIYLDLGDSTAGNTAMQASELSDGCVVQLGGAYETTA